MSRNLIFYILMLQSCSSGNFIRTNQKLVLNNDEIKWMFYSLNYDLTPKRVYRDQKQEEIKLVQCCIISEIGKTIFESDTGIMVIPIYYLNPDSLYLSDADEYFNSFYFKGDTFLFPAGTMIRFPEIEDKAYCRLFLTKKEDEFIKYLLQYGGPMDSWLLKECERRNIDLKETVYPQ